MITIPFLRRPLSMKREIRRQWQRALLSGEFSQGTGRLTTIMPDGTEKDCCLGVLCKLAIRAGVKLAVTHEETRDGGTLLVMVRYDGEGGTLPHAVRTWAGLEQDNPVVRLPGNDHRTLAALNDDDNDFTEIARRIRGRRR